jgi:hypothetical protein
MNSQKNENGFNITIVSAYITNVNSHRSIEKYIEYGKKLLNISLPKVIYIDSVVYEILKNEKYVNTIFVLCEKENIYLYDYASNITDFHVNTNNPSKDNIDYMFIQCNKTEWMKQSIESNFFNTSQYVWLDFGIFHMINNDSVLTNEITSLNNKKYDKVRIGSCWDLNVEYNINIYTNVAWYFAGSIFGGDEDALLEFAKLMKTKCIEIINEKKHLMWEVNVWYLIYKENPILFNWYHCLHDTSILYNY